MISFGDLVLFSRGWSGGAKVLGKLSVPGRPTILDNSRAKAYCACSRCGWGLFGYFFLSSFFFLPLWETARYRLKNCLKGSLTKYNQPNMGKYLESIVSTKVIVR